MFVRMSVCLSVCPSAKLVGTKTHERIKITKFGAAKISTRTHADLESYSRMQFLATFLYHKIRLIESALTFSILKVLTRKYHQTRMNPIA